MSWSISVGDVFDRQGATLIVLSEEMKLDYLIRCLVITCDAEDELPDWYVA